MRPSSSFQSHQHSVDLERRGRQHGAQAVVELVAQTAALLLLGDDQPLSRRLQRTTESRSVGDDAHRASELVQQSMIRTGECLRSDPRSEHQLTRCVAAVDQRDPLDCVVGGAVLRCNPAALKALGDDCDVGELQRSRQRAYPPGSRRRRPDRVSAGVVYPVRCHRRPELAAGSTVARRRFSPPGFDGNGRSQPLTLCRRRPG
jgi:hypothetical protein